MSNTFYIFIIRYGKVNVKYFLHFSYNFLSILIVLVTATNGAEEIHKVLVTVSDKLSFVFV